MTQDRGIPAGIACAGQSAQTPAGLACLAPPPGRTCSPAYPPNIRGTTNCGLLLHRTVHTGTGPIHGADVKSG